MKIYNSSATNATPSPTEKSSGHSTHKKNSSKNATTQGLAAVLTAMKNVARDECSRSTHAIPVNSTQLESYLTTKLGGGKWQVTKANTAGVTSEYYRGVNVASGQRVFVKLAKPTKSGRIQDAGILTGMAEVEFYNTLQNQPASSSADATRGGTICGSVRTPKCLIAETSRLGSRYVVVLEDLAKDEKESANDIRFIQPGQTLPISDVEHILAALAEVHAEYWQKEEAIPSIYEQRTDRGSKLAGLIIGKTIKQYRSKGGLIEPGSDIDRVIAATQKLGGICGMDAKLNELHSDLRSLVHGDCHGGNIYMVDGEEGGKTEVGLLDWQTYTYGNPLIDVASVLIMCLSVEDFAEHRADLTKYYLDALRRRGVDITVTDEMMHEALCCRTAYYLSGTLLGIAFVGLDDQERRAMMDRGWAMITKKAQMLDLVTFLEDRL